MAGVYVHIPFCTSKCLYCDFYSAGARIADWNALEDALITEFKSRLNELGPDPKIDTIYFGGGTPSLMPIKNLSNVLKAILAFCNPIEITLEVNPDDVDIQIASQWKELGFNRISIGIQSFDDSELKAVGRRHSAQQAIDAYNCLRNYFNNISIDLIYDIPGQTDDTWLYNLETVCKLKPEHISAYNMMYEQGTALTLLRDTGKILNADETQIVRWFEQLIGTLSAAGYEHYEISNFAVPGFRSIHNSHYWDHTPYLGIGPSAHSFDGKLIRRSNPPDIKSYLKYYNTFSHIDSTPFYSQEILNKTEILEETIMLKLRTKEGIDLSEFEKQFGTESLNTLLVKGREAIRRGSLIHTSDNHLSISENAILLSDLLILSLI
ncbi:MAG: radical SAM family heme chaperone HemW [Muribaculaceae bacterium]|nr:radical SAM family heme chaperone HemW [Muribaculaceae bacterium]